MIIRNVNIIKEITCDGGGGVMILSLHFLLDQLDIRVFPPRKNFQ